MLRDRAFYETSGGGVTLSGGDPMLQLEFTEAILARCRDAGIHTAIETAANVPWERLERILAVTDLLMMDVKRDGPGAPSRRHRSPQRAHPGECKTSERDRRAPDRAHADRARRQR